MFKSARYVGALLGGGIVVQGAALLLSMPAQAQESRSGQVEEVVVTAQRREERLQDVPIAVTSFSGAELERMHVGTVEDIALRTPNLTMIPQASGNTTYAVNMRGVALSDSVITADSPVGTYVDGVVVSKMAGGIFDFVDLERVEVLRGPQGTLYGRNTPAGAINLVTRKPSGQVGADIMVGFGNYAQKELRAALDTGSADLGSAGTLSARVSARYLKRDGWAHDTVSGDLDSRDRNGARISLRWKPNADWVVDYAFDKIKIDEKPPAAQLTKDFSGFLGAFASPVRQDTFTLSYSLPGAGPGLYGIGRSKTNLDITSHTLTAEWQVAPAMTLKSITGYRKFDDEEPTDFDGSPIAWADFDVIQSLKTFSEELQLLGKSPGGALSYVTGLYYYNEKADTSAPGVFGFGTVTQDSKFRTDNSAYAIYGQLDWHPPVADRRVTLTFGGRYTKDDRAMLDHHVIVNNAIDLTNVAKVSASFNKFTPAFTAAYAVTPDVNAYLRFAEGYRSGGFNGRASTPAQVAKPFNPESLNSYELGLKGLFFDRRLRLDAAVFVSDYKDLQEVITQPTSTGIGFQTVNDNVGKIRISGLELEAELAVTKNLSLNLSYGYLDTDVIDYTICQPQAGGGCQYVNVGNARVIPLVSRNSFTAGIDWSPIRTDNGTLRLTADAQYKSGAIGGGQTLRTLPISADLSYIPGHTLVDARVAWEEVKLGNGTLAVSAWGHNLTDRKTAQFAVNLADSLGIATTRFLTPRTYGVDLAFRFR